MALGECIFENFILIRDNPEEIPPLDLPTNSFMDCCFELPVLSLTSGSDRFKNDKSSVLFFYDQNFTGSSMSLQKYEDGWVDKAALVDDTYGTFYDFAFEVNDNNENLMGYLIDWQPVLSTFGEGTYRIRTTDNLVLGTTTNRVSFEYCLESYTQERANETVRLEWNIEGIIGDESSDSKVKDHGDLTWYNQLRLPKSVFGISETAEYEREFVRYQNGAQVWVADSHKETYQLKTGRMPFNLHEFIKANTLHGEYVQVTDYNNDNPTRHIERKVVNIGSYEPTYVYGAKLASVVIDFEPYYLNDKHERC